MLKIVNLIIFFVGFIVGCYAWQDHPDRDDHREQDRIYRDAQESTRANEYESKAERKAWDLDRGNTRDSKSESNDSERGTIGPPDRDK